MRNSSSLDWLRFMHTPNDYRVSHFMSAAINVVCYKWKTLANGESGSV